jgi:ABC-type amino acid transport system permease subunit
LTGVPAASIDSRQQRTEAAGHVVWNWRGPGSTAVVADHSRRHQAIQGLIAFVAGLALRLLHAPRASLVACVLGAIGLVLAAVAPVTWLRQIRRALEALTRAVGMVVSTIVLSMVYFGFMLPAGLLSRRRKDVRYRATFDRSATSYWTPARASESERQF